MIVKNKMDQGSSQKGNDNGDKKTTDDKVPSFHPFKLYEMKPLVSKNNGNLFAGRLRNNVFCIVLFTEVFNGFPKGHTVVFREFGRVRIGVPISETILVQ